MTFYKYAAESGIKILENLKLKVSPPNEFNDPFELTPKSKFTLTLDGMLNEMKANPDSYRDVHAAMKKDGLTHTFEEFIKILPAMHSHKFNEFRERMRKKLVEMDMQSINEASRTLGILCVSKTSRSIPMWSYYANHHKGIAVGLDFSKVGNGLPGIFGKVRYCKSRRGVNPWLVSANAKWLKQARGVIFTKSQDWLHEAEYRRVFRLKDLIHATPDQNGNRHFFLDIEGSAIREIVLGCRIDEAYEKRIRTELERRPKTFGHIKLSRCKRHSTRFELEIVSI